jgi:hypothetical protein
MPSREMAVFLGATNTTTVSAYNARFGFQLSTVLADP